MLVIRVSYFIICLCCSCLICLVLFDMFVVDWLGVPIAKFSANHITCTLFYTNIQYPNTLILYKVAKSIKSKVAKEHKYASGDIVAAAKEAKLAANKSSIKAVLSTKPSTSKSSKESFASKLKKQGGQFERGELAKKSGVDGGSTSSSKYSRRTTYGSGKLGISTGRSRGRVLECSSDDPLDVAAAQQRSSSYQDSVGSTRTKVAAAAMKRAKRGTAKAAAEKKRPPTNHVKKSRGAKSTSTSGGCSLSNVGCDKAVDKKVAAKTYSSTTSTTNKSTKSTTSASTAESDTSSSPSAIEKNLSKLRMAAKNAARSAAAKSTKSSTSKSNSSEKNTGPWQCDFCFTAKFDSYNEEAKKHEECCEVCIMRCFCVIGMPGAMMRKKGIHVICFLLVYGAAGIQPEIVGMIRELG